MTIKAKNIECGGYENNNKEEPCKDANDDEDELEWRG
jgi:hypothetical protein